MYLKIQCQVHVAKTLYLLLQTDALMMYAVMILLGNIGKKTCLKKVSLLWHIYFFVLILRRKEGEILQQRY